MALEDHGAQAGGHPVQITSLNDGSAARGRWGARRTAANARAAAADPAAIAYVGEYNSGASAISAPITNAAGLLQVSPSNSATGLTRSLSVVLDSIDRASFPTAVGRSWMPSSPRATGSRSSASTTSIASASRRSGPTVPTPGRRLPHHLGSRPRHLPLTARRVKGNGRGVETHVMGPQRLVRAGTPAEVSVLSVMALTLGAGCLALAAFPMAEDAPRGVMVGLGLVGVTVCLTLALAGPRVSPVNLHLTVVLFATLISLMVAVAATERGLMLSALGYVWAAVYVASYFRPRVARAYAVLMIALLGLSLLVARAPTDLSVWVAISAMVWVSVALLTSLNARLRAEAHTDSLTGLLNRTGFAVAAARQRAMSARSGEPLALAIIDLDDFKLVNDRGGHLAGDRLLIELAGVWTASLRPGDLLARFGGDEFVLLLAGAGEDQVDKLLARLARSHPAPWTAGAVICSDEETLDTAIDRADARLYVAKEPRRNAIDRDRRASSVRSWQPGRA